MSGKRQRGRLKTNCGTVEPTSICFADCRLSRLPSQRFSEKIGRRPHTRAAADVVVHDQIQFRRKNGRSAAGQRHFLQTIVGRYGEIGQDADTDLICESLFDGGKIVAGKHNIRRCADKSGEPAGKVGFNRYLHKLPCIAVAGCQVITMAVNTVAEIQQPADGQIVLRRAYHPQCDVRLPLVQIGQCGFALQVQPDLLMAAVKIRQMRQDEPLYDQWRRGDAYGVPYFGLFAGKALQRRHILAQFLCLPVYPPAVISQQIAFADTVEQAHFQMPFQPGDTARYRIVLHVQPFRRRSQCTRFHQYREKIHIVPVHRLSEKYRILIKQRLLSIKQTNYHSGSLHHTEQIMQLLTGKHAVITGGSDGIGLGIARAFAEAGAAQLVLVARDSAKLAEAQNSLKTYPCITCTIAADLADTAAIPALAGRIAATLPQVDILANNAGLGRFVPFSDTDEALFDAHFDLNVKAPYFLSQALLHQLAAAGGNILNISSYFAHRMLPGRTTSVYSATKGALDALTKALAFELGAAGIRVNAIAPGSVDTPQLQHNIAVMPADKQEAFLQMINTLYPLGHIGSPDDIGKAAAFLVSDHARWITGAVLAVDGGLTTH